jgi:Transglutaminase elicitor
MKSLLLASMMIVSSTAFAELYDGGSHPANFTRLAGGIQIITNFKNLPKTGKLSDDRLGWSESYWPSNKGGVAYRWNHPDPRPFKYRLHTKDELMKMSQDELSKLSPAELYDISNDDYNYSLTRKALSLYHTGDLWWEGICHGWAQAAINYPEPEPIVYTNKSGIKVPIGASDVKALLAMHEAYNYKGEKFGFAGRRCKVKGKVDGEADDRDHPRDRLYPAFAEAESPDCRDVNAGAFHVIISNMIGLHGKGFVADIDRFNDVWNQPIVGYKTSILSEESIPETLRTSGVVKRMKVKLEMTYGEELKFYTPELEAQGHRNFVSKSPVTNTPHQKFLSRNYEYFVDLNNAGNVIGGEWITQTRPDFMWLYGRSTGFKNSPMPLSHLRHIYRPLRR